MNIHKIIRIPQHNFNYWTDIHCLLIIEQLLLLCYDVIIIFYCKNSILYYNMIYFQLLILLIIELVLSTISCQDQHCNICHQQIHNYTISSYCQNCQSSWFSGNNNCEKSPPCNTPFCIECDSSKQYCNVCNQYYYLMSTGCQLKSYIVGIISVIIAVVSIITCVLIIRYCMKQYRLAHENNAENQSANNFREQNLNRQNVIQNSNRFRIEKINRQKKQQKHYFYKLQIDEIIPTADLCSICLEDSCNCVTQCNHYFHIACLFLWNQKRNICPICNIILNETVKVISCKSCKTQYQRRYLDDLRQQDLKVYNNSLCPECKKSKNQENEIMIVKSSSESNDD